MGQTQKFNDARHETYTARCGIGFLPDANQWKYESAIYTDESLIIQGHPVMERWEQEYMRELADIASSKGGDILEVGFGMGISAGYIQRHQIDSHVVIEANADVFSRLIKFSHTSARPVTALFGFWQEVTKTLPDESVSGILFDTYPLTEGEIHTNHFSFFREAHRLLCPGGVLTYYSDEIDEYSHEHLAKLHEAKFRDIEKRICKVSPPADCQYWKSDTILAPIITK